MVRSLSAAKEGIKTNVPVRHASAPFLSAVQGAQENAQSPCFPRTSIFTPSPPPLPLPAFRASAQTASAQRRKLVVGERLGTGRKIRWCQRRPLDWPRKPHRRTGRSGGAHHAPASPHGR